LARAQNSVLPGVSIEEARRSWQFWALALALFFGGLVANGMLSHSVALLTDRGISVPVAITVLSIGGIAMLIGRVLAGWCLDLFFAPTVAICIFLIPMVGIALIASGATGIFPMLGIICCGVCLGAEGDLMPYFVGRYFGLRSFGQIYGYIMAIFVLGIGVGPLVMGLAFDYAHSYMAGFVIFEAALVITCLLFTRLGPYRFPVARRAQDAVPPGAAVQP
jgi:MFS family permease